MAEQLERLRDGQPAQLVHLIARTELATGGEREPVVHHLLTGRHRITSRAQPRTERDGLASFLGHLADRGDR